MAAGVLLASPLLFYQLWAFLVPAFNSREKSALLPFVICSVQLFWLGIGFSYYFVFPAGAKLFYYFAGERVAPMLSIESYLDFFLMLVLPFGFIFNLPMALIVLASMGLVGSQRCKKDDGI